MKKVTVVIVNYRVKYFLEQTIKSVQESLASYDYEIIVIDNNSGDDSISFLQSRFSDVIFIENKENVGFAKANNQGIAMAKGEYTLILNPDTVITESCIDECIGIMSLHSDCGAIGTRMIDGNGFFLPESKRGFPTPWVSFCKIFGLAALFPQSNFFAEYYLPEVSIDESSPIDIMAGAFMFFRTDLLKRIGSFDSDFFMYGEDIDLSYRVVKSGYKNYYCPAPIIHYKGESTNKDTLKYVNIFYDAMVIFFKKHYPHYSWVYSIVIKSAVKIRAFGATLSLPFKRLCPAKAIIYNNWIVVSDDATPICDLIELKIPDTKSITRIRSNDRNIQFKEDMMDIVLDNRCMSYSEIVEYIFRNKRKGIRFHIYSDENNIIVSPKMQLL